MTRKLFSMLLLCAAVVLASCKEDTTPKVVPVAFNSLTANGSATETTTVLTLTLDKAIKGLAVADITLTAGETGAVKGSLTAKGGVYELALSGITKGGEVTVAVAKTDYKITPASKIVTVSYVTPVEAVAFSTLTANGSATETTTVLTLTFDKAIEGLAVADITLTASDTGAVKGDLTAKGSGVYELALSGITKGGEVTVAVAKTNYAITPASNTVTVSYKAASAAVGDFYMKDGTLLPGATILTTEQQADCIGIVYWTGDPTKNDAALKAAHPTCTHGLVVALKDAGTSQWQAITLNVSAWVTDHTSYAPIASGEELTDPINKIMGYNNTKAIEAFNVDPRNRWFEVVVP